MSQKERRNMSRLTKQADILNKLTSMIESEKTAALAQSNISGEPGKDTEYTSISESTETTDQNNVGPDKLNGEQGFKQEDSKDPSEPSNGKQASIDIDKFANDMLNAIQAKLGTAQTNVAGKPGTDPKYTSVSDSAETTDQNSVGPDKLNGEQGFKQEDSKDDCEPSKAKQASFDLGVAFCEALLKKAEQIKQASAEHEEVELLKEAGRRDLDTIIAQAAADLSAKQAEEERIKLAEENGAMVFELLYKQAQLEALTEQFSSLQTKLASYTEQEEALKVKQAEEAQTQNMAKLAQLVANEIKRGLAESGQ